MINTGIKLYIATLLLITLMAVVYPFRYNLGLVKPSFQVGDCIDWVVVNEFKTEVFHDYVMKVGNEKYLLSPIYKGQLYNGSQSVESFEETDGRYKKVTCPALILEEVGE